MALVRSVYAAQRDRPEWLPLLDACACLPEFRNGADLCYTDFITLGCLLVLAFCVNCLLRIFVKFSCIQEKKEKVQWSVVCILASWYEGR